jgi:hypothetical protein
MLQRWIQESAISLFKPPHSAKLNIEVDFARYYTTENQHRPWKKMGENRNIVPDFLIGHAVENFQLITGRNCLTAHLYTLSVYWFPAAS